MRCVTNLWLTWASHRRGRLASIESAQQEQLTLQRDMEEDLDALHEASDRIRKQLAVMSSLVEQLTETLGKTFEVLAAHWEGKEESSESSGEPDQASQPKDAGDVSQPETTPERSQE